MSFLQVNPTASPLSVSLGQFGFDIITPFEGPNHVMGDWACIVALEEGTVLQFVEVNVNATINGIVPSSDRRFNNLPLPVGVPIYGRFGRIKVSEGAVIAYRARPDVKSQQD